MKPNIDISHLKIVSMITDKNLKNKKIEDACNKCLKNNCVFTGRKAYGKDVIIREIKCEKCGFREWI